MGTPSPKGALRGMTKKIAEQSDRMVAQEEAKRQEAIAAAGDGVDAETVEFGDGGTEDAPETPVVADEPEEPAVLGAGVGEVDAPAVETVTDKTEIEEALRDTITEGGEVI